MQHKVVIKRQVRPWVRVLIVAGVAGGLAIGIWATVLYLRATTVDGFERARSEVETLQAERREINRALRAERAENQRLRDELTYVRRGQEIDGQACAQVRASLAELQAELLDLREQLAFYRGIVAPDAAKAGLRVYSLRIKPEADVGALRYELVLIQSMRHEKPASGRYALAVEGLSNGRPASHALRAPDGAERAGYSFRYFQEITASFTLPAGFVPRRVRVRLWPEGMDEPLEEAFDWNRVQVASQRALRSGP
jgi:hypothetical protein